MHAVPRGSYGRPGGMGLGSSSWQRPQPRPRVGEGLKGSTTLAGNTTRSSHEETASIGPRNRLTGALGLVVAGLGYPRPRARTGSSGGSNGSSGGSNGGGFLPRSPRQRLQRRLERQRAAAGSFTSTPGGGGSSGGSNGSSGGGIPQQAPRRRQQRRLERQQRGRVPQQAPRRRAAAAARTAAAAARIDVPPMQVMGTRLVGGLRSGRVESAPAGSPRRSDPRLARVHPETSP